ncbi:hypothetical protein SAY86_025790 [Trapa natans]|uniref:Peptidase S59 domain-containing protein n=1 Tax=Trapa natans TaxID=22666 RepID=A0AAN7KCI4_TRANT|nr:hypothetical protein SAY86_025790 [Trapa natans]
MEPPSLGAGSCPRCPEFLSVPANAVGVPFPTLQSADYYMLPSLEDLAARESKDPGYLSRVRDFTVGRFGYGCVKFLGETDARWLDLNDIVKFNRHEVVVYEDESAKPAVGHGLNKPAEVTLVLQIPSVCSGDGQVDNVVVKLREVTERQGATFVSYDTNHGLWKFLVQHFSRFGLSDDDEEDITMDDAPEVVTAEIKRDDTSDVDDEFEMSPADPELAHSLPSHLGLDPVRMREMRMLMFPADEDMEDYVKTHSHQKSSLRKGYERSLQKSTKVDQNSSPSSVRKTPMALIGYKPSNTDSGPNGTILLSQHKKEMPFKKLKTGGFSLDISSETPVSGYYSRNVVDSGLFMGRSFRVGWGPNGILVHSGAAVGSNNSGKLLSSVITLEKVAIDKAVRDENDKVRKELVELAFDAPMNLHQAIEHEARDVEVGSFKLKIQQLVADRVVLSDICRNYVDIVERQLEVPGLSSSTRLVLMHQVMVWELIKVLFSERDYNGQSKSAGADNEEDVMEDMKDGSPEVDPEALPLIRRAEFSCWLQEYVCHRVQAEVSSLSESDYLENLFSLLTGRQLDTAVELAVSKGDVRLALLLSQAGGSSANRSDISRQLDLWRMNGLDFNFIEKDRIKIYELLAGNIDGALRDVKIDWKRSLGLLMWYQLPPDTSLSAIFKTYQGWLNDGRAPYPFPVYIDEGPIEDARHWSIKDRFDLSYYLMLLHANQGSDFGFLKRMFSSFSSTNDPLDCHMIWHLRALLEAIGAISSNDLHVLDMGFVSQLLCLGQIHWAIYVILHMPYRRDCPYVQVTVVREILFQYCECWSSDESQQKFIKDLGVPSAWLHEAMAIYYNYYGDVSKSLDHFLKCHNWQKAHSIFVSSVSHSLFLSGMHSDIWRLVSLMEEYKSEIENWELGAGIYISFYSLRSSLVDNDSIMGEPEALESKNVACKEFLSQLSESLDVWGDRLPLEARVTYSKMAEETSSLLIAGIAEGPNREIQLSCFDTVGSAPVPEDLRSSHFQDAVSLFTCYLSELTS